MNQETSNFERVSFWELLNRHQVQIPVIQRDYAQGRKNRTKVIDTFLDALLTAVSGDPVELDFIFGDVKNDIFRPDVKYHVFRPVDGQQRLTTLFLIHWYAARLESLSVYAYASTLGQFTYDTRVSSREFCKRLINEAISVHSITEKDCLSDRIRDFPWFVGAWEFDPTVAGMLAVLDKIAGLDWPVDLWARLTNKSDAPIRFLLVELEKFGLSDDLYIKMNARGKPLTSFESFKALLERRISEQGWEAGIEAEASFAIRVDTTWTDFFWQISRQDSSGLKRIDVAFLAFIAHSLICSIARRTSSAERSADHLLELLNDPEVMESEEFTEGDYRELRARLDILAANPDAIRKELREKWEFAEKPPEISVFDEVTSNKGPQYKLRLILYAQMRLLETSHSNSSENLEDWRRVIRNIINQSLVERPENLVSGIRLIDELTEGINSIYDYLASSEISSGFALPQVNEEQRKARLLVGNPDYKSLIHRLEDTYFFRGRIAIALDCAREGPVGENLDLVRLEKIAPAIESEFAGGITPLIRRAFFTISDGNFFHYWYSWFYAKNLPKYCLIANDSEFRDFARPGHPSNEYLKKLVLQLTEKSCEQLIKDFEPAENTPNWRIRIISEDGLIERATSHFIALDEENETLYPIHGVRPQNNEATHEYLERNLIK